MSQELERVYDTRVVEEDGPSWEEIVSEWAEGASQELMGKLRQARAAATLGRTYGASSIEAFAREVGCGKSKVYDYAQVWLVYGELIEDGEFSARLENLNMAQLVASSRAPDPIAALESAHDEGKPAHRITAEIREEQQAEAEEEYGEPEVVETKVCPLCSGAGEVPLD